jgi:NitT/TauT family transport system substrate-binding protein
VRAINRAVLAALASPDDGIRAIVAIEPLFDAGPERRRLDFTIETLVVSPESRRIGLGDVDDARLARSVETLREGFGLTRSPAIGEVFDRRFLPPLEARRLPASLG